MDGVIYTLIVVWCAMFGLFVVLNEFGNLEDAVPRLDNPAAYWDKGVEQ